MFTQHSADNPTTLGLKTLECFAALFRTICRSVFLIFKFLKFCPTKSVAGTRRKGHVCQTLPKDDQQRQSGKEREVVGDHKKLKNQNRNLVNAEKLMENAVYLLCFWSWDDVAIESGTWIPSSPLEFFRCGWTFDEQQTHSANTFGQHIGRTH